MTKKCNRFSIFLFYPEEIESTLPNKFIGDVEAAPICNLCVAM